MRFCLEQVWKFGRHSCTSCAYLRNYTYLRKICLNLTNFLDLITESFLKRDRNDFTEVYKYFSTIRFIHRVCRSCASFDRVYRSHCVYSMSTPKRENVKHTKEKRRLGRERHSHSRSRKGSRVSSSTSSSSYCSGQRVAGNCNFSPTLLCHTVATTSNARD